MSNKNRTTFYIGVTNELKRRVFEHATSHNPDSFTTKYNLFELVYYEILPDIAQAIEREKQLKNWHRDWKINLIKTTNPKMKNLAEDWFETNRHSNLVLESQKQQMLKQVQHDVGRLHYITQEVEKKTHAQLAEEACLAGVDWVQLRVKNKSYAEWKATAIETLAICRKYHVKLIINDNVELAKEINADGVHLGKEDISTAEARKILGANFIIGGTANTFEDIKMHVPNVDYIGLGPFRFTSTKEKLSPILGIEGYKQIINKCRDNNITIPIVAIGGITSNDVAALLNTGVYGIAIASAITFSKDKRETVNEFLLQLEHNTIKAD